MSASESIATPTLPTSPFGAGVVGVVAHLGRQVEGARQPRLTRPEEELEALVGLLGRPEPGVLAHGPEPAPVHRRVDAPGIRVRAGFAELRRRVPAVEVGRLVDGPDLDTRVGQPLVPLLPTLATSSVSHPQRLRASGGDRRIGWTVGRKGAWCTGELCSGTSVVGDVSGRLRARGCGACTTRRTRRSRSRRRQGRRPGRQGHGGP